MGNLDLILNGFNALYNENEWNTLAKTAKDAAISFNELNRVLRLFMRKHKNLHVKYKNKQVISLLKKHKPNLFY